MDGNQKELSKAIEKLKKEIEERGKQNIELFNSIPIATKEDPLNEKAEPILTEWRNGSKIIKSLIKELAELERIAKDTNGINDVKINSKTFVNGFGEATKRDITCSAYERAESRNKKSIMSFVGGK